MKTWFSLCLCVSVRDILFSLLTEKGALKNFHYFHDSQCIRCPDFCQTASFTYKGQNNQ